MVRRLVAWAGAGSRAGDHQMAELRPVSQIGHEADTLEEQGRASRKK